MQLFNILKSNFYTTFFELKKAPSICININPKTKTTVTKTPYSKHDTNLEKEIISLQLVPDYLKIKWCSNLKKRSVFQKKGYAANLSTYTDMAVFMTSLSNSSFRKNVKRSIKKAEVCFDISYTMYYGNITTKQYNSLMDCFYNMLNFRFKQLKLKNEALNNWEHYRNIAFEAINNKTAALFVMFNNNKPIAFTLNFHFDNICYSAIPTFNTDYYKFSIGNVVIYKNIEWYINNNFELFDMGYGGFENKLNWCNTVYNFNHVILFCTKKTTANIYSRFLSYKYAIVNYLLSKNVNTHLNHLKYLFKKNTKTITPQYTTTLLNTFPDDLQNYSIISLDSKEYNYLKRPIFDFLFSATEHINNITTYKSKSCNNIFFVKGKHKHMQLTLFNN